MPSPLLHPPPQSSYYIGMTIDLLTIHYAIDEWGDEQRDHTVNSSYTCINHWMVMKLTRKCCRVYMHGNVKD